MSKPSDSEAITDLVTGQLSPLAAWRLRCRIARSPELARELSEAQALFDDLQTLRMVRPTCFAPGWSAANSAGRDARPTVWNLEGQMKTRAVFVATAILSLALVTGGYAAMRYRYGFDTLRVGHAGSWKAIHTFRGEVRFADTHGEYCGSFGTDGGADDQMVTATVVVNGYTFTLRGAGKHQLYAQDAFLGTAELVPETPQEREVWREKHDRENGIVERLHISYGARDGYGQCVGFFDVVPNNISWKLRGDNVQVRFYNVATGKQVYQGTALAVDDAVRAEQKRVLPPGIYRATVALDVPVVPKFEWSIGQGAIQAREMGQEIIPLADGTRLRAEIVRLPAK